MIIEQVTASAMVFPPPSSLAFAAMQAVQDRGPDDLPSAVHTAIIPVHSGTYLRARNWLSITSDNEREIFFQWRTEQGPIEPAVPVKAPR